MTPHSVFAFSYKDNLPSSALLCHDVSHIDRLYIAVSYLNMAGETTRKIHIWTTDRSLGTVFLKALSSTKDAVIFNGLFTSAYYRGPEKQCKVDQKPVDDKKATKRMSSYQHLLPVDVFTYDWAEKCLAASYPGKMVFFKDQAYALCGMYHKLPEDSQHSVIIRHPFRVLPSMKKYTTDVYCADDVTMSMPMTEMYAKYMTKGYGYIELHDLIMFLCEKEKKVVIIDADDLQTNAESIMRQYCEAVGVPFQESFLQWEQGEERLYQWHMCRNTLYGGLEAEFGAWYRSAVESTHFLPPQPLPSRHDLSSDVLEIVDVVLPYYQRLYDMRIKPDKN